MNYINTKIKIASVIIILLTLFSSCSSNEFYKKSKDRAQKAVEVEINEVTWAKASAEEPQYLGTLKNDDTGEYHAVYIAKFEEEGEFDEYLQIDVILSSNLDVIGSDVLHWDERSYNLIKEETGFVFAHTTDGVHWSVADSQ